MKRSVSPPQSEPNSEFFTGDIYEAPIDHKMWVEGGSTPPEYGDPLDATPSALSIGDLQALDRMGDPFSSAATAIPSKFFDLDSKPDPRTVDSSVRLGRRNAAMQLSLAGVATPGAQASLLSTALTVARLSRLGDRAAGKIPPSDSVPFSYAEKGRLHLLNNIREGAGLRAELLKIYMQQQYVTPAIPFRRIISSTIPAVGASVSITSAIPAAQNGVPYASLIYVVRLSSTLLNSNPSKTLSLTISEGAGGVITRSFQNHIVSYDTDGVVQLVIIPAIEVSGNYWPRVLPIMQDTAVPANTLDVIFTLQGNDGVSDNMTIFAIGPDDFYWRQYMNRLS